MEGDGPDTVAVAVQNACAYPFASVPQSNRPVIAATGQQATIWAEGDSAHAARMVLQYTYTLTCVAASDVPKTDGPVITATGEVSPIGTEGDGPDAIGMPTTGEHGCIIRHTIEPDSAIGSSHCQVLPSGMKGNCQDVAKGAGKNG